MADNRSSFIEHYTGRDDIPDEHRVFSMPKLSIREQMSAFKEIIDRSSLEGNGNGPRWAIRNDNPTLGQLVPR